MLALVQLNTFTNHEHWTVINEVD